MADQTVSSSPSETDKLFTLAFSVEGRGPGDASNTYRARLTSFIDPQRGQLVPAGGDDWSPWCDTLFDALDAVKLRPASTPAAEATMLDDPNDSARPQQPMTAREMLADPNDGPS